MLLAVDVGNTNTVLGLFDSSPSSEPLDHWRLTTDNSRTADEWMLAIGGLLATRELTFGQISGFVTASVVPKVNVAFKRMAERVGLEPLFVNWQTTDMPINLDNPAEIGPDRIANAIAVREKADGPVIVVDMGTATTFDVVGASGAYEGGIILPGLDISLEALFDSAAALGRIDLTKPAHVVGKSTAEAIRSGVQHGYAAQIDGLCHRIEESVGAADVVATGGLAAVITPYSRRINHYDPWLTLRGLQIIHERKHEHA